MSSYITKEDVKTKREGHCCKVYAQFYVSVSQIGKYS